MLKGNSTELKTWAPNSITLLAMEFLTIFLVVISLNFLYTEIILYRRKV